MKKIFLSLIVLAFLVFDLQHTIASYCSDDDNYRGQVQIREKGKPVKNAKIKIKGITYPDFVEKLKADEYGIFFLCSADYEDGDYMITAKKSGYEESRYLLSMNYDYGIPDPKLENSFTMDMDKIGQAPNNKGEISGRILNDYYEEYIINLLIEGTSKTNYSKHQELNIEETGFNFKNLKPDVYTLTFTRISGSYYIKVIDLKKNMKCSIYVYLDDFEDFE